MASVVDICNTALGHVANSAELVSIDPPDGSAEADHCARYYPMARDECLAAFPWSFAIAREYLAELQDNPMVNIWGFAYQLPNALLRPLAVLQPGATNDSEARSYLIETAADGSQLLYTNVEAAILKYIYRQEDTAKFTPLFTVALATNLASYLAGPLVKDIKLKQGLKAQALRELNEAAARDTSQKVDFHKYFVPGHIAVRG